MSFFDNYNTDNVIEYMNEAFDIIYENANAGENSALEENSALNEANVIKLDNQTMKKKMIRRAELAAAKAADDPLYHKYVKHTKIRKQYRRQIHDKYNSKANIIYKQWVAANRT